MSVDRGFIKQGYSSSLIAQPETIRANRNKIWRVASQNDLQNTTSTMRVNREVYFTDSYVADELNTYRTFDPFPTFNDYFAPEYSEDGKTEITPDSKGSGTPGVRSIFNRAGAVIIGSANGTTEQIMTEQASAFRISNNVPLFDNPKTRDQIKQLSKCTVKDLVQASQQGLLGKAFYSYSDFMYCKYLGRMSNNYMVTLRRFPYPVDDYISTIGVAETDRKNPNIKSGNADSIGCLVTWMGTPGNEMANILKYSIKMPFKEQKAQWHQGGIDADAQGGIANSLAAAFDPQYRQQYNAGQAGARMNDLFKFIAPGIADGNPPYPASQWNSHVDQTKVYGPVDAIKTTYSRSEDGLDFAQTLSLTFDYELRAYNGINPRQAMLDLISNILHITYNTGTFWGGGYRGGGAHQNNVFTNLPIFTKGDQGRGFAGYIDSFSESFSVVAEQAKNKIDANGGIVETLKKLANSLGGMLVSGMLNKLGRPQKAMANSLLSPAPVGLWHVTIGNPYHPIMSMGNMILTNTSIQHYGPLGIDDFPTGLRVTCELTRGKSRDIRDIEKIYMHGNDRIYTSMGKKVLDMYHHAKEYRSKHGQLAYGAVPNFISSEDLMKSDETSLTEAMSETHNLSSVLQHYYGHSNRKSIIIPAMEQEHGAGKKKGKDTAV